MTSRESWLAKDNGDVRTVAERRWKRIASYLLFAFFFMFVGHLVLSYIRGELAGGLREMTREVDSSFLLMIRPVFLLKCWMVAWAWLWGNVYDILYHWVKPARLAGASTLQKCSRVVCRDTVTINLERQ